MTQEEKDLLLKDLCGRLPYGVILNAPLWDEQDCEGKLTGIADDGSMTLDLPADCIFCPEDIKPYLRPMSSMTEAEREEYIKVASFDLHETVNGRHYEYYYTSYVGSEDGDLLPNYDAIDWLNEHHFDYRGLIEKNLAIEVTEENNPYERK